MKFTKKQLINTLLTSCFLFGLNACATRSKTTKDLRSKNTDPTLSWNGQQDWMQEVKFSSSDKKKKLIFAGFFRPDGQGKSESWQLVVSTPVEAQQVSILCRSSRVDCPKTPKDLVFSIEKNERRFFKTPGAELIYLSSETLNQDQSCTFLPCRKWVIEVMDHNDKQITERTIWLRD